MHYSSLGSEMKLIADSKRLIMHLEIKRAGRYAVLLMAKNVHLSRQWFPYLRHHPASHATVGVETLGSLLKPLLNCQDFQSKTYPSWKPPIALQSTGVGESSRSLREEFCWDERSDCQLRKTKEISVNVIRIGHTKGGHFTIKRTAKEASHRIFSIEKDFCQ